MQKLDISFLSELCMGAVEEGCWEPRQPPTPGFSPYAAGWWVLGISSSPCSLSCSKDSAPRDERLQQIQRSQGRAAPCGVALGALSSTEAFLRVAAAPMARTNILEKLNAIAHVVISSLIDGRQI